jgi:hypothetical protein
MLEAAEGRADIDTLPLMMQATASAAEADAAHPGVDHGAIDWIRFGELLRHLLGWDDSYPAYPDFPEARDVP